MKGYFKIKMGDSLIDNYAGLCEPKTN